MSIEYLTDPMEEDDLQELVEDEEDKVLGSLHK